MASLSLSSGDSSSPVEEEELELGLGLGPPDGYSSKEKQRNARILTAQKLPPRFNLSSVSSSGYTGMVSSSASSSSNSPIMCSTLGRTSSSGGVKRPADSPTNNSPPSHVVGWPPIRTYRMNNMTNQAKSMAAEGYSLEEAKNKSSMKNDGSKTWPSSFVKVYMDGILIGRKIDLGAQGCYEKLAQTLEDMFFSSNAKRSCGSHLNLMNESSGYMLAYEDKDGDWMLVGDVPWRMFVTSVKRLKIMRTSEAA